MLEYNRITRTLSAKNWLSSGWKLFKKSPLTWVLMILIFTIFYVIAMSSLIGKCVAALLTPILLGGMFVAAHKSDSGETVALENLFSMFRDSQKFKQLVTIGVIGVVTVGLSHIISTFMSGVGVIGVVLSLLISCAWLFACFFGIPLVAIKNQMAIESLKSSLFASLVNYLSLLFYFVLAIFLIILGILPVGLGLLVVLPVLFCTAYFSFKSIYLEGNDQSFVSTNLVPSVSPAIPQSLARHSESFEEPVQALKEEGKENDTPMGFEINYFDDHIQITRTWFGGKFFSMLFGALIFNFVWILNDGLGLIFNDDRLLVKLFFLGLIALGLGFFYAATAYLLNQTTVIINKKNAEVKHRPVPWIGNEKTQLAEINKFHIQEETVRSDSASGGSFDDSHELYLDRVQYNLNGITPERKSIVLLKNINHNHAQLIKQKIETYLGEKNEN